MGLAKSDEPLRDWVFKAEKYRRLPPAGLEGGHSHVTPSYGGHHTQGSVSGHENWSWSLAHSSRK